MFHVVLFNFHSIYYSSPFSSLIIRYVLLISNPSSLLSVLILSVSFIHSFSLFLLSFCVSFFVFHNLTRLFPFFYSSFFFVHYFFLLIFNPLNYIQYNKSYIEYNIPRLELYIIVNSCKHVVYK